MIAGKRVPAAYRKNNRVSHLTADAVRQMGYVLEDSGKKLTVGQQRPRRRTQRGGTVQDGDSVPHLDDSLTEESLQLLESLDVDTDSDDEQPEPKATVAERRHGLRWLARDRGARGSGIVAHGHTARQRRRLQEVDTIADLTRLGDQTAVRPFLAGSGLPGLVVRPYDGPWPRLWQPPLSFRLRGLWFRWADGHAWLLVAWFTERGAQVAK